MVSTISSATRLSSVVPASVTGENKDRHLSGFDLAMKLHYIKAVYFFTKEAASGLTIYQLKEPMFPLLAHYYTACGRIRRRPEDDRGRPFIKCNDGGVRIAEAHCGNLTLEEWLHEDKDDGWLTFGDHVLGPDLGFSPLVYVQFTWFKCGGLSVGLSWSHVLGDPFSASTFINTWAHLLKGHVIPESLLPSSDFTDSYPLTKKKKNPSSIKRVDPVGDCWRASCHANTETHTFHLTSEQLNNVISRATSVDASRVSCFDILAAIIWKSLAKLRGDSRTRTVTVCWKKFSGKCIVLGNNMAVGAVDADFAVAKSEVSELAELIAEKKEDERELIEGKMEAMENIGLDCVVYGANLTFVNLEDAEIYELEMKGRRPIFAKYMIEGVGEEGMVLVLPGPFGTSGRVVTLILPTKEVAELKEEMRNNWGIV
ncbi:Protein ECERIFERUM 2 [Linum perenne]